MVVGDVFLKVIGISVLVCRQQFATMSLVFRINSKIDRVAQRVTDALVNTSHWVEDKNESNVFFVEEATQMVNKLCSVLKIRSKVFLQIFPLRNIKKVFRGNLNILQRYVNNAFALPWFFKAVVKIEKLQCYIEVVRNIPLIMTNICF